MLPLMLIPLFRLLVTGYIVSYLSCGKAHSKRSYFQSFLDIIHTKKEGQ